MKAAADAWWRAEAESLPENVNERTVTHRMAVHLEQRIRELPAATFADDGLAPSDLHVDCEYNRRGSEPKRLGRVAEQIACGMKEEDWPLDTGGHTVYPDIIVHRRGAAGPNLIVIEVKRRGARTREVAWDEEKLRLYQLPPLRYYAFFVVYGGKASPSVRAITIRRSGVL